MLKLEPIAFPGRYLECHETTLITILKYMGLSEETPLMGTQAYFIFRKDSLGIWPKFNCIDEEWERVHDLTVVTLSVGSESDLRERIIAQLDSGRPVCLSLDIYFLPHTPHYSRLHQVHSIDIFGYDNNRYYIVCPYYQFMGWVDRELIHASFFSPATKEHRSLIYIPELKAVDLSPGRVYGLVQENCQNMLGLTVPEAVVDMDPQYLGLSGIRTCFDTLWELVGGQDKVPPKSLLGLSTQMMWVGNSRYWFSRLIQSFRQYLLPAETADDVREQFATVVKSWRDIGLRFGAGIHGNRPEMIEQSVLWLEQVYEREKRLFNNLLGALPDYEEGSL